MNTKNLDHLLFLEEVESEQSLAWATEQTKRAKNDLQKDSRFNFAYENILNVYQDKNRLKVGVIHRSYYYNFGKMKIILLVYGEGLSWPILIRELGKIY